MAESRELLVLFWYLYERYVNWLQRKNTICVVRTCMGGVCLVGR